MRRSLGRMKSLHEVWDILSETTRNFLSEHPSEPLPRSAALELLDADVPLWAGRQTDGETYGGLRTVEDPPEES